MPYQDTSQQSVTLTDDETANAAVLFGGSDEGSTPADEVAQTDGPVSDDAPTGEAPTVTDGEMGDSTDANETADATPGVKSTDEAAATDASDDVDPELLAEADAVANALLGNEHTEPADNPVWMQRAGDMTRRFNDEHRAHQESKANIAETLATVGLELVETANGLKTARVEGYKDSRMDDFDARDAWAKLPDADQAKFETEDSAGNKISGRDAFMLAYETGVRQVVDTVPHATAKSQDRILPDSECNSIFSVWSAKTLPNGDKAWPDCDSPTVQLGLQNAANAQDDVMLAMRAAGSKDPVMHKAMLEMAYNRHYRSQAVRAALIAKANAKKTEQAEKDKASTASVPGTGGGTSGNQGSQSAAEQVAEKIGSWQGSTHAADGTPYIR